MKLRLVAASMLLAFASTTVHADFVVSEMIVDFKEKDPRARDVEIISKDKETQYIATETYVVENAGLANEKRTLINDPSKSGLMLTPNKMALGADSRKLVRLLVLAQPADKDIVYRVAVKPVIQGLGEVKQKVALKVLVGYEMLVFVRPKNARSDLVAERKGNSLTITNQGNSNAYLQGGEQCDATGGNCKTLGTTRLYAGQKWSTTLPHMDGVVKFKVLDAAGNSVAQY